MKNLTNQDVKKVSGAGNLWESIGSGGRNQGGFNIAVTPPNGGFGVSVSNGYIRTPNGIQWGQPTLGASWTWRW